jgi:hypothetical protein
LGDFFSVSLPSPQAYFSPMKLNQPDVLVFWILFRVFKYFWISGEISYQFNRGIEKA